MSSQALAADLEALTLRKVEARPGDAVFARALEEVRRLRAALQPDGKLSPADYEGEELGLLCVRELETVDPGYCERVYAFLEAARPG